MMQKHRQQWLRVHCIFKKEIMYTDNGTFSANQSSYEVSSSVKPSIHPIDLPALIENLKHATTWKKGELNAMILLKSKAKKIVLTIMHKGTEVKSFQEDESATFQIIEGKLNLRIGKASVSLNKGELLTLREKLKYTINSIEESALLLTLSTGYKQT